MARRSRCARPPTPPPPPPRPRPARTPDPRPPPAAGPPPPPRPAAGAFPVVPRAPAPGRLLSPTSSPDSSPLHPPPRPPTLPHPPWSWPRPSPPPPPLTARSAAAAASARPHLPHLTARPVQARPLCPRPLPHARGPRRRHAVRRLEFLCRELTARRPRRAAGGPRRMPTATPARPPPPAHLRHAPRIRPPPSPAAPARDPLPGSPLRGLSGRPASPLTCVLRPSVPHLDSPLAARPTRPAAHAPSLSPRSLSSPRRHVISPLAGSVLRSTPPPRSLPLTHPLRPHTTTPPGPPTHLTPHPVAHPAPRPPARPALHLAPPPPCSALAAPALPPCRPWARPPPPPSPPRPPWLAGPRLLGATVLPRSPWARSRSRAPARVPAPPRHERPRAPRPPLALSAG
jgi:hypothetical protein